MSIVKTNGFAIACCNKSARRSEFTASALLLMEHASSPLAKVFIVFSLTRGGDFLVGLLLSACKNFGTFFNIMAALARHYFPIVPKYFILAWGWREEVKGNIGIWHTILPLLACPLVQNTC